jgi:asparagine synthase (glutamine-hydrolysing)
MAARQAGWGIDVRDPTIDRRIVDFCLALPEDQYLRLGTVRWLARRAFADRLPAEMLDRRRIRKGKQAPDYHEQLEASREALIAEVDRMAGSAMAARCLDLSRMRRLIENWPKTGWQSEAVTNDYRLALLRGVGTGRFILDVEGGNG